MLGQAVALSILVGFLSTELLGLYTGGMITAGYLAFYFETPLRIAVTLAAALGIWALTKLVGRFVILYGRRRFMLSVLLALMLGWVIDKNAYYISGLSQDLRVIGYIIPGLIANDMSRQGAVRTLLMTCAATLIVRLILMAGTAL